MLLPGLRAVGLAGTGRMSSSTNYRPLVPARQRTVMRAAPVILGECLHWPGDRLSAARPRSTGLCRNHYRTHVCDACVDAVADAPQAEATPGQHRGMAMP